VEDTALVLMSVRMILEDANFTVLAAASTSEAIELAQASKRIDMGDPNKFLLLF
jgi:CheY-like chemotaxis protein